MPLSGLKRGYVTDSTQCEYEDVGNSTWSTSSPHLVSMQERSLFVHQGEIGWGLGARKFYDVIGSDDATTCFILLARHRTSDSFLVTHVDSATRAIQVGAHVDSLAKNSSSNGDGVIDIYISGGIWDKPVSVDVLSALLKSINDCSSNCHLRLLNFAKNCGEGDHSVERAKRILRPVVQGCGFLIGNQEDDINVIPMIFPLETRGPLPHFRQAMMMTSDELRVVVSLPHSDRLLVSPAGQELRTLDYFTREFYHNSLSLSDEKFLRHWSTSPHCEPPHFISDFRETIACILQASERDEKLVPPHMINGAAFQLRDNYWTVL